MAATFVKGHTFTDGETVNDSDLHALVESATVSGISRTNCSAADGYPGLIQLTRPSDLNQQEPWAHPDVLWWTTLDTSGDPVSCRAGGLQVILASSSSTVEPGNLVQADGIDSNGLIRVTMATGASNVLGVAATRMLAGAKGVIVAQGITAVLVASDASATLLGKSARGSAVDGGKAREVAAAGSGYGFRKLGVFLSNEITGKSGDGYAWVSIFR